MREGDLLPQYRGFDIGKVVCDQLARDIERTISPPFFVSMTSNQEEPDYTMQLKPRHSRPTCQKGAGIADELSDQLTEAEEFHKAADFLSGRRIKSVAVNGYGQIILNVEENNPLDSDKLDQNYEDPHLPVRIAGVLEEMAVRLSTQFEEAGQALINHTFRSLANYVKHTAPKPVAPVAGAEAKKVPPKEAPPEEASNG